MCPASSGGRPARPIHLGQPTTDTRLLAALLAAALAACVSYQPSPVDPAEILASLRGVRLEPEEDAKGSRIGVPGFDLSDGLTVGEAAAIAVTLNPGLRAARSEAGIAAAQLVEAGLLPDPGIGWDAMDWIVGATSDDALGGLGLLQPLRRPGETTAREGIARGRAEEVRWTILEREWRLKREVHLAFLALLGARERLALNRRFQEIAARTHDFFARSREVGAATALQENLARLDLAEVRREGKRLQLELSSSRQALNALLGLPPGTEYRLQAPEDPFAVETGVPRASVLTDRAVEGRPGLKELLGRYAQAEENLRLQVARQWPLISVGTGIELVLPVFTRFNQPAIRTAWEIRQRLRRDVEAAVHQLRGEVHAAVVRLQIAQDQVEFFRAEISPQLEESLRLTEQALRLGEATLVEILTAQRQVLDTRRRFLEARIENARAHAVVTWVSGQQDNSQQP